MLTKEILKRSSLVAVVVGTILNLINNFTDIIELNFEHTATIGFTYLVPFLVSLYTAYTSSKSTKMGSGEIARLATFPEQNPNIFTNFPSNAVLSYNGISASKTNDNRVYSFGPPIIYPNSNIGVSIIDFNVSEAAHT
jgi:hypothetical protein